DAFGVANLRRAWEAIPVARCGKHGTGKSHEPADKNVCATSDDDAPFASKFGFRVKRNSFQALLLVLTLGSVARLALASTNDSFQQGVEAYRLGEYGEAAKHFQSVIAQRPASGALVNLGLAEWHRGQAGTAVLAWEQARWIDPYDRSAR